MEERETKRWWHLDRVHVCPALFASNADIALLIVSGLNQDNCADEAEQVDDGESKE